MNNNINFALNKIRNLTQDVEAYYTANIQFWFHCNFLEESSIINIIMET